MKLASDATRKMVQGEIEQEPNWIQQLWKAFCLLTLS